MKLNVCLVLLMCDETLLTFIKESSQEREKKRYMEQSVLIALRHCKLQVENLDHIITTLKNWFDDPCLNHTHHMDLIDFMKVENLLAKENYDFG